MAQKKQNPWVVGVLAVLAVGAIALVINTILVGNSATRGTRDSIERIREAGQN